MRQITNKAFRKLIEIRDGELRCVDDCPYGRYSLLLLRKGKATVVTHIDYDLVIRNTQLFSVLAKCLPAQRNPNAALYGIGILPWEAFKEVLDTAISPT